MIKKVLFMSFFVLGATLTVAAQKSQNTQNAQNRTGHVAPMPQYQDRTGHVAPMPQPMPLPNYNQNQKPQTLPGKNSKPATPKRN